MYHFGSIIKKIRKDRHLTQKMLADSICSQSVLSRIENNEEVPNVVVMQQLCKKLDVSIDQMMDQDPQTIQTNSQWLELMTYYYQTKNFTGLNQLLRRDYIENLLYTAQDLQKYHYYLAISLYQLEGDLVNCLKLLQKSLNYTYTTKKKIVSDMEVLLLSEIGRVYFEIGEVEIADYFFKKSIALFYTIPSDRYQVELTKIFYNAATACIEIADYPLATDLNEQGLTWARKKNSYYFLEELFLLKGIILEDNDQLEQATKFVEMAELLRMIASGVEELK